jgi:large subunit ribosomal protein L29
MNPIDLRKKSIDDLSNELVELRKAQFTARIQITTQHSNKNDQLSKLQKDIARVKTIIAEKVSQK